MKCLVKIPLNATPAQIQRLLDLQALFARVCNALGPEVQTSRIWNRVTLHHLHYRSLRERFPLMGSQMVCNAIYAVSRAARSVFQTPSSPFFLSKLGNSPLPLLQFASNCPVYFDRHTLSISNSKLSLFTLDGRMHFELTLPLEELRIFRFAKLKEISLRRRVDGIFELIFILDLNAEEELRQKMNTNQIITPIEASSWNDSLFPEYLSIEEIL
jgi:hypothetical protein